MLCENPSRRTGLSTLFDEFVGASLRLYPDVNWLLFAGPEQPWRHDDPRVRMIRAYPANNHRYLRLWADHFLVGPAAQAQGAAALLTLGFVPLRAPLPVVMHLFSLHHLSGGGGWRGHYRRRAIRGGLARAALVVVNSRWTADQLTRASVHARAPLISPEGLQHDRFRVASSREEDRAARQALKLPESYLLWSSNFYPYKQAERALAAYAALPMELRRKFPLVLVGGDWEGGLERARTAARTLSVETDTRFLGWIDDAHLPACYRGATAHVLSTMEETFGRSVLEAMACGCPCLLQDLPVLREVAGDAAVFVDYADTTAASAGLLRLCTDETLRRKMIDSGLERAARFSFERLARERIEAIRAVLKR